MPFAIILEKKTINIRGQNKVIIDLFKEAANEIHSRQLLSELQARGVVGNIQPAVTNEFARFLYTALGAGTDFMILESRTYLLDSVPYKAREEYVRLLTLFMNENVGLTSDDTENKECLESEFAILHELFIRTITVALSNELAEAPLIFSTSTPVRGGNVNGSENHREVDGDNINQIRQQNTLLNVSSSFNFIGFLRIFIQKLDDNFAKLQTSTWNNVFFSTWLKRLKVLSKYLISTQHGLILRNISSIKKDLDLLRSNKRILREKLNFLNDLSKLIKRCILLRLEFSIPTHQKFLSMNITRNDFKDNWLTPTLDKIVFYFLGQSEQGKKLITAPGKTQNNTIIPLATQNVHDLVNVALSQNEMSTFLLSLIDTDPKNKAALHTLFKLHQHNQIYLDLVGTLSDLNEVVGWTVLFSGIVNLQALAKMLNTHLASVQTATESDFNDPVSDSKLAGAVEAGKVFNNTSAESGFDSLATLMDPQLLQCVCKSVTADLRNFLQLAKLTHQLPDRLPDLIDTTKIMSLLKGLNPTPPVLPNPTFDHS